MWFTNTFGFYGQLEAVKALTMILQLTWQILVLCFETDCRIKNWVLELLECSPESKIIFLEHKKLFLECKIWFWSFHSKIWIAYGNKGNIIPIFAGFMFVSIPFFRKIPTQCVDGHPKLDSIFSEYLCVSLYKSPN